MAIDRRGGHGYFIPVLLAAQLRRSSSSAALTEAIAVGEEAVEAAWTTGDAGLRLGAHGDLALARHLAGDPRARSARRARRSASAPQARLWRARAGWTLGLIRAADDPAAGIAAMLEAAGGPELPEVLPAERPVVLAALADAELRAGDLRPPQRRAAARLDAAARPRRPR